MKIERPGVAFDYIREKKGVVCCGLYFHGNVLRLVSVCVPFPNIPNAKLRFGSVDKLLAVDR